MRRGQTDACFRKAKQKRSLRALYARGSSNPIATGSVPLTFAVVSERRRA